MEFELAVDIGGTFTDLYLRDGKAGSYTFKTPTTPHDLTEGLFNVFGKAADTYDITIEELLSKTRRLVHGTTVSTNAIIEGNVSKTALICTEGFRDILLIREGGKEEPFNWDIDFPEPYIPRSLTFEVEERINAEGGIETPLNENQTRHIVEAIKKKNVDAVAISLLWAHVNPKHERRIGEIIDNVAPDIHYSLSHKVNPTIREYRRTISTAIDASIYDLISEYISKMEDKLKGSGYSESVSIITANGGVMSGGEIRRKPIWTVDSGPTMLPVAALTLSEKELGKNNVIAVDMGGTSLDIGVVREGRIPRTREGKVKNDLLGIEKVEVKSIGSGGGSIAWVDEGGLLHVGPMSAGAEPGPACYMHGGMEPTLTDAVLVLGYLNEDYFLGGEMPINSKAAEDVIEKKICQELDIGLMESSYTIFATAVQNMTQGIREVTIERGIDPREHVLAGGGGALGIFVVPLARELGMKKIILPREAGVISSWGGLITDTLRPFSASLYTTFENFDFGAVNDLLSSLESQAKDFFDRNNISEERRSLSFFTEARYPNQVWELEVQLPPSFFDEFPYIQQDDEQKIKERFNKIHEQTYGFSTDENVEFLYWRAEAVGEREKKIDEISSSGSKSLEDEKHDTREAYFDKSKITCPAYLGKKLAPNHEIKGPSFIDLENSTIILPPDSELSVTDYGNFLIVT